MDICTHSLTAMYSFPRHGFFAFVFMPCCMTSCLCCLLPSLPSLPLVVPFLSFNSTFCQLPSGFPGDLHAFYRILWAPCLLLGTCKLPPPPDFTPDMIGAFPPAAHPMAFCLWNMEPTFLPALGFCYLCIFLGLPFFHAFLPAFTYFAYALPCLPFAF